MSGTYLGIDYHKKFSFITAQNEKGEELLKGKVLNTKEALKDLLGKVPGPVKAVVETSRTHWVMVDLLKELDVEVVVANSSKLRAIATCQIKTDQRDSDILAHLLRTNLIPKVHIPSDATRLKRSVLRRRMDLAVYRTNVKNRIHLLLDRNHASCPEVTDLFGSLGRAYLKSVKLPPTEDFLLKGFLRQLDFTISEIKDLDKRLKSELKQSPEIGRLMSIPGIGSVLASTIFLEMDTVTRFKDPAHFISYAGLCPTLYASGGRSSKGHLIRSCNRTLKWAFVEAAWVAIRSSAYCGRYFMKIRQHVGAKSAVVATARRLALISYRILKEERFYEERTSQAALTEALTA